MRVLQCERRPRYVVVQYDGSPDSAQAILAWQRGNTDTNASYVDYVDDNTAYGLQINSVFVGPWDYIAWEATPTGIADAPTVYQRSEFEYFFRIVE